MGQRTKGIAQGDTSGHANAARLQVDASRTFADTLRGIGASVGGGIERASVRKREDARYRQQRADATEERDYQRGRQSWRDQMDYDREVYRREQDALDRQQSMETREQREAAAGLDVLLPQYEEAQAAAEWAAQKAKADPSALADFTRLNAEAERLGAQVGALRSRIPGVRVMQQPAVGGEPMRPAPAEPASAQGNAQGWGFSQSAGSYRSRWWEPQQGATEAPAEAPAQAPAEQAAAPAAAPVDPHDPEVRYVASLKKEMTLRELLKRFRGNSKASQETQGEILGELAVEKRRQQVAEQEIRRRDEEQAAAQERQQKEAEQKALRQEREKALPEWDKARREAGIGDAEWGALSRSFASGEIDAKTLAGFMYRERTADRMDAGAEYRKGRDQTKDAESRRRWEANRTDRMAARKPDGTVDGDRVADVVDRFVSMYGWSDNYAATLSDAEVGAGLKSQRLGPATRARFEELAQQRGIGAAPAAPAQPAPAAAPADDPKSRAEAEWQALPDEEATEERRMEILRKYGQGG